MRRIVWTLVCVVGLSGCGGDSDASEREGGTDLGAADAPADRLDLADCHDDDADGHRAASCGGDDCDDANPGRYPGNSELCDSVDQDCDPLTLGPDADGDGSPSTACCNPQPSGAPVCGTDCDDLRATVNATAVETCNHVDDDCDGATDEDGAGYYADCDADGYGGGTPTVGCALPSTPPPSCPSRPWVTAAGDCDDVNAAVHPSADETCNAVDDDCDGVVDDGADTWCGGVVAPHAGDATCTAAGTCTWSSCAAGWLDCGPSPGCETDATIGSCCTTGGALCGWIDMDAGAGTAITCAGSACIRCGNDGEACCPPDAGLPMYVVPCTSSSTCVAGMCVYTPTP